LTLLAIIGPAAAILIEQQRARLAELVIEKDRLITRNGDEARDYRAANSQLQAKLEAWEGKADPSALWPPTSNRSPLTRLQQSLLQQREEVLKPTTGAEESDLRVVQRYVTLGLLYEAASRNDDALTSLQAAVPPLERMRAERSRSIPIAAALRSIYDRLARLTKPANSPASRQWAAKSHAIAAELAQEFPDDAAIQAAKLDADLRKAVAEGFAMATEDLASAREAERRLGGLWPTSVEGLYELACQLAGVAAPLSEVSDPPAVTTAPQ
jgi:hypothetical protein